MGKTIYKKTRRRNAPSCILSASYPISSFTLLKQCLSCGGPRIYLKLMLYYEFYDGLLQKCSRLVASPVINGLSLTSPSSIHRPHPSALNAIPTLLCIVLRVVRSATRVWEMSFPLLQIAVFYPSTPFSSNESISPV